MAMASVILPTVRMAVGTFALTSVWTRPDSVFAARLAGELAQRGHAAIQFRRFLWSGGNTFSARAIAQRELVTDLDVVAANYPGLPHFLITHSHGGTVALATLLESPAAPRVAGCACLGTPFLVGSRRSVGVVQTVAFSFVPLVAVSALAGAWYGAHPESVPAQVWPAAPLLQSLAQLWQFVAVLVIAAFLGAVALRYGTRLRDRALPTLLPPRALPESISSRLLLVRSRGDEAAAGLGFGYLMVIALQRAWRYLSQLAAEPFRRGWDMFVYRSPTAIVVQGLCAAAVVAVSAPIWFNDAYRAWMNSISTELPVILGFWLLPGSVLYLAVVAGRLVALPILQMLLYLPLTMLLGVFALPFGPELMLASMFIDISAEPVPVGRHRVIQLAGGDGGLNHSTYDHPECPPAIAEWMHATLPRAP